MSGRGGTVREAVVAAPVLGLRAVVALLPWRLRVGFGGALGRLAIRVLPRLRRRVEANLAHVMPGLPSEARARILRETGDTFGRTVTEMLFADAFRARAPWREPTGPGAEALRRALAEGRGAILVSGHIGQWEAGRAWVKTQGRECAGIYRPLRNRHLEALYHRNIASNGAPMFPKGRRSVRAIARHIAEGGVIAFLVDQYDRRGAALDFLGRPAPTTLTAAEFAIRYGVEFFPCHVRRDPDGIGMVFIVEAPLPRTDAREMMQRFNDLLGAWVRETPGQYYWLHRRWSKDVA
jgi:KDO2-lipid IV(A) lauroyltransferase